MSDRFDAVILADGEFPESKEALCVLRSAAYLCCCDNAGKRYLERLERGELEGFPFPDAIVGDGDSVSEDFFLRHADIYHRVTEQDYNDLTKATRFILEVLGSKAGVLGSGLKIACLGTTGKREDHTIGNIFLIPFYQREFGIDAEIITDHGTFVCGSGKQTFRSFPRQQVSIFNINCRNISGDGLKWNPYCYRELWQGTLNEALSQEFTIDADGQYIIYQTHLPKL